MAGEFKLRVDLSCGTGEELPCESRGNELAIRVKGDMKLRGGPHAGDRSDIAGVQRKSQQIGTHGEEHLRRFAPGFTYGIGNGAEPDSRGRFDARW